MNIKRKAIALIVSVGISMSISFQERSTVTKDTKEYMLNSCSADKSCQTVVNTYFKRCFNTYYHPSGYSSRNWHYISASADTEGLTNCINQHAGIAYFKVE